MSKNVTIANQSNPYNQLISSGDTSSGYISNLYPSSIIYQQPKDDNVPNAFIIYDIPTIFTIVSAEVCGPKLVRIKYTIPNSQLNTLSEGGNIYISSGIFGIYDSSDNFYWRNEVVIEVESEEHIDKIKPEMKFTNATQWEKKLSIEEVIDMVNDPFKYYKYVHKIVEQNVHDKPRNICIAKHQEIDKLYGLE